MCSTMVSSVEPLAQRSQPSTRPIRTIWASMNKSYCTCMPAHTTEVAISVPPTPRKDALRPRNRKPRNTISSVIGATTATAMKKGTSALELRAER